MIRVLPYNHDSPASCHALQLPLQGSTPTISYEGALVCYRSEDILDLVNSTVAYATRWLIAHTVVASPPESTSNSYLGKNSFLQLAIP